MNVNIRNNPQIVLFIRTQSRKGSPVWIVRSLYNFVPIFVRRTWNTMYENYGDFWINRMLKFFWVFNINSVIALFFQTFCENILRFFIIMLEQYSQQSKLSFSRFLDFLIFLHVPLFVKVMFPKRTSIWIDLMIAFTIQALEKIGAWFTLLCFESQKVCLEVLKY